MTIAIAIFYVGALHRRCRGPGCSVDKPASSACYHPSRVILGKLRAIRKACGLLGPPSLPMEFLEEPLLRFDIGCRCDGVDLPTTADQTENVEEPLVGKTA